MLILRNIHIASSEFEMCLLDLSPHPAPPQYLPNAVNVVIEECLLHLTFEGLPIPTEILTNILQHLCIIGVAAVTTAPFTLQHIHCHPTPSTPAQHSAKTIPEEGGNSIQPDRPPALSSPDPLTTSTLLYYKTYCVTCTH